MKLPPKVSDIVSMNIAHLLQLKIKQTTAKLWINLPQDYVLQPKLSEVTTWSM